MAPLKIGLTGGIGSGKTTAAGGVVWRVTPAASITLDAYQISIKDRIARYVLDESRLPEAWYNIAADLPEIVANLPPAPIVCVDGYHGYLAVPTDLRPVHDRVFYLADDSSVSTGFDISLSGSGVVDTRDGKRQLYWKGPIEVKVIEEIIKPVLPKAMVKGDVKYLVNPTGAFEIGGPKGDCVSCVTRAWMTDGLASPQARLRPAPQALHVHNPGSRSAPCRTRKATRLTASTRSQSPSPAWVISLGWMPTVA